MATANDSAAHPTGKPAPIACTVLSGDPMNALLAVNSECAGLALDIDVPGKPCIHLLFDQDPALDLALRITGTVMRRRRAATA
jgi:hypothetical protein